MVAKTQVELMQKHGGQCQSMQTGLSLGGALGPRHVKKTTSMKTLGQKSALLRALKGIQALEWSVQTRGEPRCCSHRQYEKKNVFFEHQNM